jgi:uncharacterized YccA/Bax inhibitor family protein
MSGVCEDVKSILKTVAVKVIAVIASFNLNVANPKDAGLAVPLEVVGVAGGFS